MPKIVDHDDMKRQIAFHAIDHFRRQGYQSASMRDLAREIGISKSGMYHYFASKEDLFQYAGKILLEENRSEIKGERPYEQCLALVSQISVGIRDELYLLLDYMKSKPEDSAAEVEQGRVMVDDYRNLIYGIVGQEKGEAVLRIIFGEFLLQSLGDSDQDLDGLKKALSDVLSP